MQNFMQICLLKNASAQLHIAKSKFEVAEGTQLIEDDSIVGNSDRMFFYAKELIVSSTDMTHSHNPYLITKLDMQTLDNFDFKKVEKSVIAETES